MNSITTVGELFGEAVACERNYEAHGILWAVLNDLLKPTDNIELMWDLPIDKKTLRQMEKNQWTVPVYHTTLKQFRIASELFPAQAPLNEIGYTRYIKVYLLRYRYIKVLKRCIMYIKVSTIAIIKE
ncbi:MULTISPECIES: hypothetical protein [unclassified Sporosarcina]|uniref:hypothetical protein n=1 Tax=unclassified Sporosarcina TaxID=2647733 RepID=UPI00203CB258|nr:MULTISPECIES: hypothetical protein [unclassified Sporosarcina]GKV65208.1 hypothetical protein NCCP2331_13610 [Sporosarcina sp. NCCP-2331]GLB55332.1 hypothetical protein NCCP2378_11180 [Sporosarcina sp. NCCP-2378]